MKSVGEVMVSAEILPKPCKKACQSLENNKVGLGADGKGLSKTEEILGSLQHPSWDRIFKIKDAIWCSFAHHPKGPPA